MISSKISSAIENHSEMLMAHAMKFTRNPEDASDLVQETFLKAFRFLANYTEVTNLSGWLFIVMKNTFISKCNSMASRKTSFVDHSELPLLRQENSTLNLAIGKMTNEEIRKALANLPISLSEPFILHFEGYTYKELSALYAIPMGTVKTRIHLAKKILRQKLAGLRSDGIA